jgi:hypothetical protein
VPGDDRVVRAVISTVTAPRYTARIVARAREHRVAGWSLREIKRLLREELDADPAVDTIHGWCEPLMAEQSRKRHLASERRRNVRERPGSPRGVTPDRALERMRVLRENGCSYRSIAVVAAVWWGEVISGDTVRYRLQNDTIGRAVAPDMLEATSR